MSVFANEAFTDHENVVFCSDPETGLRAIIAVHSTALGPAAGGCRMWPYENEAEAVRDVLRLSQGMSYKNAMAGLELGGGKAVIIGNAKTDKSEELFSAYGRFVERLGGQYITAEDVGISVEDMEIVARETRHVAGLDSGQAASGDPSPFTARGTFNGIRAGVKHRLGRDDVEGLTVAVQGLGHVGWHLCRELSEAGANLLVADVQDELVSRAVEAFGAVALPASEVLYAEADVIAPCALGAVLSSESIPHLNTKVVAGAANNQLAEAAHGALLKERGILYAPDYVINAGGIINVAGEVGGAYDRAWVDAKVAGIYDVLMDIFARAEKENLPTNAVADAMAQEKINKAQERAARRRPSRLAVA